MIKQICSNKIEMSLTLALLVAFLLNIKKVLIANVLGDSEPFNEYLDVSLYLFDIIFLGWFTYIVLKHRIHYLSIYREMFHACLPVGKVEHLLRSLLLLLVVIILWQWLSLTQAERIPLALRNALTMTEVGVFILIQLLRIFHLAYRQAGVEHLENNKQQELFHVEHLTIDTIVPRGTFESYREKFIQILSYFALFNAFIVFIQVSTQQSVGLKYLGESFLQVGDPGIATLTLFGEKILRGYGLFLHPNIAAAFFGLLILIIVGWKNVPPCLPAGRRGTNIEDQLFHVEQWRLGVIFMALLLTFSRTGILLTLFGILLIVPPCLPAGRRGTILNNICSNLKKLFHVEQSQKDKSDKLFHLAYRQAGVEHWLVAGLLLGVVFFAVLSSKSLSERELSLFEYTKISNLTAIGNGPGSYPVSLYESMYSQNEWAIQPIHNFFLFFYYEFGLVGLFLIVFLGMSLFVSESNKKLFHVEQSQINISKKLFHVEQSQINISKKLFHVEHGGRGLRLAIGIFLLGFALSDHFFFTIPQGQILFWWGVTEMIMSIYIDKK